MALVFISKSALRERIPSNFDVDGSELVPAEVTRIEIPAGGAHDCSGETGSARKVASRAAAGRAMAARRVTGASKTRRCGRPWTWMAHPQRHPPPAAKLPPCGPVLREAGSIFPSGREGCRAAIASCQARAATLAATDSVRISSPYGAVGESAPSPVVDLDRAVALSTAHGPEADVEIVERERWLLVDQAPGAGRGV